MSPVNALFEGLGDPRILTISPRVETEEKPILVLGDNFGRSAADLEGIYIEGTPCLNSTWRGRTAVECLVPPPSEELIRSAFNNRSAYFNLEVAVVLTSGQRSLPNRLFGYDGRGDPPFNQPFGVIGYRGIDSSDTVHLRWLFTD